MNSAKIFILVLATLTVVSSAQVPSNDFAASHQGHNDEFHHDPDISIKEDNADFFKKDEEIKLPINDADRNDIDDDFTDVQLKELENVKSFEGAHETPGDAETKTICPAGWTEHTNKCYKAFFTRKEWADARGYCKDIGNGGALVTIDSSSLNALIASITGGDDEVWIGLNDRDAEGVFRWVKDNARYNYSNWATRQPDDGHLFEHENCVVTNFLGDDGEWNDSNCDYDKYFACQIDEVTN